jgi:hypothetical protein
LHHFLNSHFALFKADYGRLSMKKLSSVFL